MLIIFKQQLIQSEFYFIHEAQWARSHEGGIYHLFSVYQVPCLLRQVKRETPLRQSSACRPACLGGLAITLSQLSPNDGCEWPGIAGLIVESKPNILTKYDGSFQWQGCSNHEFLSALSIMIDRKEDPMSRQTGLILMRGALTKYYQPVF